MVDMKTTFEHRSPTGVIAILLAAIGVILFPFLFSDYIVHIGIMTLLFAHLGSSWNLIAGYGGIMSIGQAVFYGIGAYTSSILLIQWSLSPWIGMIIGALISALVALFIGYLCFHFKLKGWYFGLTTVAFGDLFLIMAINFFPGKAAGLYLPLAETGWSGFQFLEKKTYYFIILGFFCVCMLITRVMIRSRIGYYLRAIREDEDVAESLGVYLMRYKLISFAISAFLTALGGTFYAQYMLFVDPPMVFSLDKTLEMIIRVLVGGMGTYWGPLVGSIILTPMGELFNLILGQAAGLHLVFYGVLLVIFIIFLPYGLVGLVARLKHQRSQVEQKTV